MPDHRRLFVSGTASISVDGETVYLDNIDGQVAHTMRVATAILESRGMDWQHVARAVAYFKQPEFAGVFNRYCVEHGLDSLPVAMLSDDVCRQDLLFEIEADALAPGRGDEVS